MTNSAVRLGSKAQWGRFISPTPQWYGQNPLSLPLSSLDCQPSRMRSRKRSMLECVSMVHCCHDSGCPVNGHRPFSASTACTEDQSPTQTPDMTFRLCATAILRAEQPLVQACTFLMSKQHCAITWVHELKLMRIQDSTSRQHGFWMHRF